LIEKKTLRATSRKIRGSRKPQASRIASRGKHGKARACNAPKENHGSRPAKWYGQTVPGSTTVLVGTAVPLHGRSTPKFRDIYDGFPSFLGDLSLDFFESSFRVNLGFTLGLNKLH